MSIALDWPSSICGSKVVAKKLIINLIGDYLICVFQARSFEPDLLENQSRALKT